MSFAPTKPVTGNPLDPAARDGGVMKMSTRSWLKAGGLALLGGVILTACQTEPKKIEPARNEPLHRVVPPEPLPPLGPDQGRGLVRLIWGTAEYALDGLTWHRLAIGHELRAGMSVRTAPGSQMDVFLGGNGPVIRICPESSVRFDELALPKIQGTNIPTTRLTLIQGQLWGNVRRLPEGSTYQVQAPKAVLQIESGEYNVCECGRVVVSSGTVRIKQGAEERMMNNYEWYDSNDKTFKKFRPEAFYADVIPHHCPWAKRVARMRILYDPPCTHPPDSYYPPKPPPLKRAF